MEVLDFTDGSGKSCLQEIAEFPLSLLTMLLSNADVEHMSPQMNVVKSSYRNKMKNPMLSGILRVGYGLKLHAVCLQELHPTTIL